MQCMAKEHQHNYMAVETQSKSHYSFHYLSIASLCLEDAQKHCTQATEVASYKHHQSKFKMSTSGFQLLNIQVSDSPLLPPSFSLFFLFCFFFSFLSLFFPTFVCIFTFECFSFFRMLLFLAQTCVLKVHVNCNGCKQKVKKLLSRIEGPDFDNTLIISFFKLIYLQAILFLQAFLFGGSAHYSHSPIIQSFAQLLPQSHLPNPLPSFSV